jgi:hypothetical protein
MATIFFQYLDIEPRKYSSLKQEFSCLSLQASLRSQNHAYLQLRGRNDYNMVKAIIFGGVKNN